MKVEIQIINNVQVKKCSGCKVLKSLDCYHKQSRSPTGLAYNCNECTKILNKRRYDKNKDQHRTRQKINQKERYKNDPIFRENKKVTTRDYYYKKKGIDTPLIKQCKSPNNIFTKDELRQMRYQRIRDKMVADPDYRERVNSQRRKSHKAYNNRIKIKKSTPIN
jgi:hypothetical protein